MAFITKGDRNEMIIDKINRKDKNRRKIKKNY